MNDHDPTTDAEAAVVSLGGGAWRSKTAVAESTDDKVEDPAEDTEDQDERVFGPDDSEAEDVGSETAAAGWKGQVPVDIRNFSVKCGSCGAYQTITSFRRVDEDWNEYTYVCEEGPCSEDSERSKTILEIPSDLDVYARRDPTWRGGKRHAGAG